MTAKTMTVFDPAMCCSTGVCGPDVDPRLVRFAADLDWIAEQGVKVTRFNLAQQPGAFVQDADAKRTLEIAGESGLPLIKVDGVVKSSGTFPVRHELAAWAGVAAPTASLYTEAVAELVAIGASIASNCEPCFKFHYDKARKLGVSRHDMLSAVATAQAVKDTPARAVFELAQRYLSRGFVHFTTGTAPAPAASTETGGCCGAPAVAAAPKKSGCC